MNTRTNAIWRRSLTLVAYLLGTIGILASGGGGGGDTPLPPTGVTASFTATPSSGVAPLDVSFDGSASSTQSGTITAYEWDFGDGGSVVTAAAATSHRYTQSGSYTARLTVRTSVNTSASATRGIQVISPSQATWLGGYETSLLRATALNADLTRSGDQLSGSYQDIDGRTGTLTATISGSAVTIQMLETTPGCSGDFSGTGVLDLSLAPGASAIFFDFSGTNCDGSHLAGQGVLVEQLVPVLAWGLDGLGELRASGGEVFFSDASEFPLKKVNVTTGQITPLAFAMRAITSLRLSGNNLLWTDFVADFGEIGCAGSGVVRALVRANADGSNPRRLAVGDFCGFPAQDAPETDGTYAYWVRVDIAGAFIERVPLSGGASQRIATIGDSTGTAFALDASHIYWTESLGGGTPSSIKRCPLSGCGGSAPFLVTQGDYFFAMSMVLSGDQIYLGLRREGSTAPAIVRVPKAGGDAVDLVPGASGTFLHTDGQSLFWAEEGNLNTGSISAAPLSGGASSVLASDLMFLRGIALGSDHVFWVEGSTGTNRNDGKVRRVPKTGGAIENLKMDAIWPAHIQVNAAGEAVYADGGLDEFRIQGIRKVPLAGGVETVAVGVAASGHIDVDDNFVYASSGFSIIKVARSGLGNALLVSPAFFYVEGVETDGNHVYWQEKDPFASVFRAPVGGSSSPTLMGVADGVATGLRLSRDYVYASALSSNLIRVPKTGGVTETIAANLAFPDEFVVDEEFVYVTESDSRSLTQIRLSDTTQTTLTGLDLFFGWYAMDHDSNAVYLMSPDRLVRVAKSDGTQSSPYGPVLQDPFLTPAGVAVDNTNLYWTETLLGAVKMAPK